MKSFFILEGNNGATYILNVKNVEDLVYSLNFYKARTFKQKVMKRALKLYMIGLKAITSKTLKSNNEIEAYFKKVTEQQINFNVDEHSSILISSTRDKVIVHHHGEYFHKFAFGKSYSNVKNEAKIYRLLDKPLEHFSVSTFYDLKDNIQKKFCSFKLGCVKTSISHNMDITAALVELYSITKQEGYSWSDYLESLKEKLQESRFTHEAIDKAFEQLEASTNDILIIPLGLVHRDFKPWNINDENGLLIYDFEEAVTDGPPLEDLFNFYIDPIIRYVSSSEVKEVIFKEENVKEYIRYLQLLHVKLDFKKLLYSYCIERTLFWDESNKKETALQYTDLLECLMNEKGIE